MERKKIISQSSLREFENDGDFLDKYYLPARGLILPGDFHVLPEINELTKYASHLNQILQEFNLPERKTISIPDIDYLLDLAILGNLSILKRNLPKENSYLVYPYAITDETLNWINELKKYGFNIEPAFPKKVYFEDLHHPSHRGGWGRWVDDSNKPSFPERYNLPYPTSWIGQGLDQLKEAYERVVNSTKSDIVFFKPIFSAGGFTLAKISSLEELINHYEKLKSQRALEFDGQEIPVEIQSFIPDIQNLYSFQYDENGNLITPQGLSMQIVYDNQWQGNIFNFPNKSQDNFLNLWERFKTAYKQSNYPFGWGGVDIAQNSNGSLIILEHNGLRITGAHPAISLAQQLKVNDQQYATLKAPGNVNCDLATLHELLRSHRLFFNPFTRSGVFPITWFPGSGMLWATGQDPLEILNESYNILLKEGYVKN